MLKRQVMTVTVPQPPYIPVFMCTASMTQTQLLSWSSILSLNIIILVESYLLTYLLTPWNRVLVEKLTGLKQVKKFPVFYGTRNFITTFTSARHLCLSRASSIQSTSPHPNSSISALILYSHLRLGLPIGLFHSCFLTKSLYTALSSPIRATRPAHLILLDFITRTIVV
jgi:hypothetical protein